MSSRTLDEHPTRRIKDWPGAGQKERPKYPEKSLPDNDS
jgi:hypothetical protein